MTIGNQGVGLTSLTRCKPGGAAFVSKCGGCGFYSGIRLRLWGRSKCPRFVREKVLDVRSFKVDVRAWAEGLNYCSRLPIQ